MKYYWNNTEVCKMLSHDIKFQPENCLHKPPLEIALKVVGKYNLESIRLANRPPTWHGMGIPNLCSDLELNNGKWVIFVHRQTDKKQTSAFMI